MSNYYQMFLVFTRRKIIKLWEQGTRKSGGGGLWPHQEL